MQFDSHTSIGHLLGIPEYKARTSILQFIENCLPQFIEDYRDTDIANEDGLNQELVNLLNARREEETFIFSKEHLQNVQQGNAPRTDFAVCSRTGRRSILMDFEAKRLVTHAQVARRKEYVIGRYNEEDGNQEMNSGGIERFKNETHGVNVNYGGMIGYVQEANFDAWLERITQWINDEIEDPHDPDLTWEDSDHLDVIEQGDDIARYHSESSRIDLDNIHLFHFWVNLQN